MCVRYFRNPCDRDPPAGNFNNFKFCQKSLKILNLYFWRKSVYFGGRQRLLLGKERLLWGLIGVLVILGNIFCVAGGFWDSEGRGAP